MDGFIHKFEDVLEMDPGSIKKEDRFREFEEWDSLALLSLMAVVEEEYGVTLPYNEFEECQTVEEIFQLIESKTA